MLKRLIGLFFSKKWQNIEYFNENWKSRIKQLSTHISIDDKSIVDLGCGMMWLREYLPKDIEYTGVDYVFRDNNTIICDFNKNDFPVRSADVYFISGCMEYVEDPLNFIKNISLHSRKCILSYCCVDDVKSYRKRNKHAWKSHMSKNEIIEKFEVEGMSLVCKYKFDNNNTIFVFEQIVKKVN